MDSFCSRSYSTNTDRQRLFTSCVSVSKISCSRWKLLLPSLAVRVRVVELKIYGIVHVPELVNVVETYLQRHHIVKLVISFFCHLIKPNLYKSTAKLHNKSKIVTANIVKSRHFCVFLQIYPRFFPNKKEEILLVFSSLICTFVAKLNTFIINIA